MEKTVKIGNKSIRLNNNIGWAIIYKDQFGRDIIPAIMPLFASAMDVVSGIIAETGKAENITIKDIAEVVNGDVLTDAFIHLSGLELVDFINITWALAKSADENIEEPAEWIKQFDEFPLDVIVPKVAELVTKGLISSKNLKRLMTLKKKIQPSNSTQSSSQPLSED